VSGCWTFKPAERRPAEASTAIANIVRFSDQLVAVVTTQVNGSAASDHRGVATKWVTQVTGSAEIPPIQPLE
jgi:hypothetical protein